jgi:hypothetical protein
LRITRAPQKARLIHVKAGFLRCAAPGNAVPARYLLPNNPMTEQAHTLWLRMAIQLALLQRDSHRLQQFSCSTIGLSQSYRIESPPPNPDLEMIEALQEKWDALWDARSDLQPDAVRRNE